MVEYNDPFNRLIKLAQKSLSESDNVRIQFDPELSIDGGPPFGTTIQEQGTCNYIINVAATLPVIAAVEILAHELAHVLAGLDNEHNEIWEAIFSELQAEFESSQLDELRTTL